MKTDQQEKFLLELDEQKLSRLHWRMVGTAGVGFFTDAYDLFVIGVVTSLLIPLWHLTDSQIALLNGASLASAAFGAIVFGWFSDTWGRKTIYGIEVCILFVGALFSAFSISYTWLLVSRILVGIGIGGDYPTSAVVASEYANRKNRGFLVLLVFAMQAVGLIVGPLFTSLLMVSHISYAYIWRILLAFGAIPAASVFYLRRKIAETPRFLLSKQPPLEVSRIVSDLAGHRDTITNSTPPFTPEKLFSSKWLKCLFGTSSAWFLLDVALYGNGISSVLIMNTISPHASLLRHTLLSVLIFLCFAVPGYFFSAAYVDKIGRRFLQTTGFSAMALCYLLIASVPSVRNIFPLFIGVFGISFFFINFGPNATTFLIPSEIYPTHIRARAHGFSAAIGKVGAFVGTFFLPIILTNMGLPIIMIFMTFVSLLGIFVTYLVPEMKGVSLQI
ncbi:MFS transporter [Coxiella endosymbiont of Amblyomma sculptum]|uniref:MFS transporter n=1 Tax=Coxiella endosymbiont of Amblyomma sculptum TaxID=2487929 RepID=UPI00132E8ED7|nr:MFS transporter [Coxiella endosymbiont of Amblyomma sculptum]QHG92488.1 MFS transporter [Coxiella endosymbiont of Amblyomma sculptum]